MHPIHIKEIKKDDIFYEYSAGSNHKIRALEDAQFNPENKQWSFTGHWIKKEEDILFMATQGFEHYGPKLWKL